MAKAILQKVSRANLCLICDVQFGDETAMEHHYLNVHHVGNFACKVNRCGKVEKTNGDLRMHHCLWHLESTSSSVSLPVSSNASHYCFVLALT